MVFTQNATAALKHVGECYPFAPDGALLLTSDNHNSVNGIPEFAAAKGASIADGTIVGAGPAHRLREALSSLSGAQVGDRAQPVCLSRTVEFHRCEASRHARRCGWDVLLDAASFVPTNRLDLSVVLVLIFVSVSFYKMFGYPTVFVLL